MPILKRLQDYLDERKVAYHLIRHQEAYTASEIAHTLHISGKMLAKVVIVKTDGRFVMAVLPSHYKVDFERLADVLGGEHVRLATEGEFQELFPDCGVGAMPPFGNLYGLEVFVDQSLTEDEEIVFQAGSHLRAMKLRYQDFADLVHPIVTNFHLAAGIPGN
ncbi:MAG TPA: deacylase [Nitrospiraceae bacterium]|nr:deacylase [Nitrospiraceae bacterium]